MDTKKLFLNSTDVANITGHSLRNARNIMKWIRDEKGLSKQQGISIYHFCECFDLPLDIVFMHINNKEFKLLPLDEYEIRKKQSNDRQTNLSAPIEIDLSVFDPLVHKTRNNG